MSYLQSAIEYADEWLEFDPTKSRYSIKIKPKFITTKIDLNEDFEMGNTKQITNSQEVIPDKDMIDFVTQINTRFMNLS